MIDVCHYLCPDCYDLWVTNSKSTRRVYFVLHARFFVSALIQGSNQSNAFWDFVCGIIKDPSPEQEACHAPKPILLDTGEMHWPYDWHPRIIDTQLLKVGQFAIAAVPGEFTTMSGRSVIFQDPSSCSRNFLFSIQDCFYDTPYRLLQPLVLHWGFPIFSTAP